MKYLILKMIIFFYLVFCTSLFISCNKPKRENIPSKQIISIDTVNVNINNKLVTKAAEALKYCEENNMNTDFCLLFDVKEHSGKNRLFVWDFKGDSILMSSLCAHGCGRDEKRSTGEQPLFSNEDGSYLTSLGKYKIGVRSYSNWGINVHYKLHGLDSTNNNAFKRIVVLHSHTPVPDYEVYPYHLPMGISQGCPVVDNTMMTYLDVKLKNISSPVLLWIYY